MKLATHRFARWSVLLLLASFARPALAGIDRFTPFGPMNGEFLAFVADPNVPGRLLAAPSFNGLYGSLDGGHTWTWSGAGLGREPIQALAADPANPGTFYAIASTQAFRSTDGGQHWAAVASGEDFTSPLSFTPQGGRVVASLTLFYSSPGGLPTLLVGAGSYVQWSNDGGVTWRRVYTVVDAPYTRWWIVADPIIARPIWAAYQTVGQGGSVLWSEDGGFYWSSPPPLLPAAFGQGIAALTALPVNPQTILAAPSIGGLFRSTDRGANWHAVTLPPDSPPVSALAYEPATPSIVYAAAGDQLFVSEDFGETWHRRGAGLSAFPIRTLATGPGRTVYALTQNDIEVSHDRGRHWAIAAQSGFENDPPHHREIRFRPGDPSTVYMIEGGQGFVSADGGATWGSFASDRDPFYDRRVNDLAIDPVRPDILYLSFSGSIYRSADGGATWSSWATQPTPGFDHLQMVGRRLSLAADCGVSLSHDGGHTWTRTLPCTSKLPGEFEGRTVDRLQVDPANPAIVYAELTDFFGRHPQVPFPQVWQSHDGGGSWKQLVPDSEVIALDPSRSGRLYVARTAGIARSDDGGRTFRLVSSFGKVGSGILITDLLVDPATPTTLYAASRQGIWRSEDRGVTWAALDAGLARYTDLSADFLALHPTLPHRLYAGVDGWIFQNQLATP